jgi:hypothetical protein
MTDIEGYGSPGMYALVQMLEKQPAPVEKSVLLSTCILSDKFYLVPTSSFHKPAFVVDNVGCNSRSLFVCTTNGRVGRIILVGTCMEEPG